MRALYPNRNNNNNNRRVTLIYKSELILMQLKDRINNLQFLQLMIEPDEFK